MKNLLIISLFLCVILHVSAQTSTSSATISTGSVITGKKNDTIYIVPKCTTISIPIFDSSTEDSLREVLQKEISQNDSLRTQLGRANLKINKVKFYLNICLKNSSQDKFLKGWIRRAVE